MWQDEDETEQKETERKDSRSSEASDMEEDGEGLPLSISEWTLQYEKPQLA